jgi:hypothetical protein
MSNYYSQLKKIKCEVVPDHPIRAYMRSRDIALLVLKFGAI